MDLLVNEKSYIVFDLDDTLYEERSFLESGFRHIDRLLAAQAGRSIAREMIDRFERREDVFQWIVSTFQLSIAQPKAWLLHEYRTHVPTIALNDGARELLDRLRDLNAGMGLMTDGRSITQRNKIEALGLGTYMSDILISEEFGSEKPDPRNCRFFAEKYPDRAFTFIGDNTAKDFIVPAKLGWTTICLRCSGRNIHRQDFTREPRPDHVLSSLRDVRVLPLPQARG